MEKFIKYQIQLHKLAKTYKTHNNILKQEIKAYCHLLKINQSSDIKSTLNQIIQTQIDLKNAYQGNIIQLAVQNKYT